MRKAVFEVQCERCARKETQELEKLPVEEPGEPMPAFTAFMGGRRPQVTFGDLCGPCTRTVRALLEQIAKKVAGLSPDRGAKVVAVKAPATETAAKKEELAPAAAAPRSQAVAKVSPVPRSS